MSHDYSSVRKMGSDHLLICLLICFLEFSSTTRASSPQDYWTSQLHDAPMPEPIRNILPPLDFTTTRLIDEASIRRSYVVPKHERSDRVDPSLYFLEKDLKVGNKMTLQFIEKTNPAVFLPREAISTLPFSSGKLPELLSRFSTKVGSENAKEVAKTLEVCEMSPAFDEEHRECVTSLESMIDYATVQIGKDAVAVTTTVDKDTQFKKRVYTIGEGIELLRGWAMAVCHKLNYPYAVYQCHAFSEIKAHVYRVPFESFDGTKAEALAVCHYYIYDWDPIFVTITKMLKASPSDHVCHFLGQDTIVWKPRNEN